MKYDESQMTEMGKKVKSKMLEEEINEEIKTNNDYLSIFSLGQQEYERFVKKIGGDYEKYKNGAILIDDCVNYSDEGVRTRGSLYNWKKGDTIEGTVNNKKYNIQICEKTDEKPMGLEGSYTNTESYIIISDEFMDKLEDYRSMELVVQAKDCYKLEERINQYMLENQISTDALIIGNVEKTIKAENAIVLVISIFLYGFISVITLIGITNIFNTITTNMNLRKKEFAMLKSIGMTKKEFNRMIRLESMFYGFKSLIIGIPIGIILSFEIYKMFDNSTGMVYELPIKAIFLSIIFVIIIVSIIMKYSMSKINKHNIIETIRNDNI